MLLILNFLFCKTIFQIKGCCLIEIAHTHINTHKHTPLALTFSSADLSHKSLNAQKAFLIIP